MPLEDDDSGLTFKSFEITSVLGHGSYGIVYQAYLKTDLQMQPLAMKVQNKKTLLKKKQLKYAVSEANIMKQFDNPFIVKLLYAFQTPTNLYLVLEHCSGGDLEYHLDEREVFDEELAKFFAAEILLALEYLHSK